MKGFLRIPSHHPGFVNNTRFVGIALAVLILALVAVLALLSSRPAQAQPAALPPAGAPPAANEPVDNAECLACHQAPAHVLTLPNGETASVAINPDAFNNSVHSKLTCTTCHPNISGYPHPAQLAADRRSYTLQYQETCKDCHADQFSKTRDSVHARALASGNLNGPTCSDCHNPHTQTPLKDAQGNLTLEARAQIPQTCAKCHNTLFNQYANSVHGQGVLLHNNPDVPTCTNCHGVHDIADPTTAAFRLSSISLCASCHTNHAIMDKYNISTDVLNTYVSDFHGTTTTLFLHQSPNEMTNKPVCYDCHGIHDIVNVNDPQKGLLMKQNILVACQRCHPDANLNFPDAWLSHYIPSRDHAPLVYYVDLFYKFFIPMVLGGMLLFVLTDVYRRVKNRRKQVEEKPG